MCNVAWRCVPTPKGYENAHKTIINNFYSLDLTMCLSELLPLFNMTRIQVFDRALDEVYPIFHLTTLIRAHRFVTILIEKFLLLAIILLFMH